LHVLVSWISYKGTKDDGKIGAIVTSSNEGYVELEITSPIDSTSKVRPGKGLNFPDSDLNLPSITSEDINNLDFVVKHATAVAFITLLRYSLQPRIAKVWCTDCEGTIASLQNNASGKPTWILSRIWRLITPLPTPSHPPSSAIFRAVFEMIKRDGGAFTFNIWL
jgi:hypothetical protein